MERHAEYAARHRFTPSLGPALSTAANPGWCDSGGQYQRRDCTPARASASITATGSTAAGSSTGAIVYAPPTGRACAVTDGHCSGISSRKVRHCARRAAARSGQRSSAASATAA